ncbi:alcohol dehydrogenase catalytic domain-containing protein [Lentzea sp. E54]|uniref:alcohol dehydrogenase catalytic domain-containing protein n=1 Tax=Lentzea xerophila TaxID=3435883 RepID=UPI003DA301F9
MEKPVPTGTMNAIRLHEYGGPEVLRYEAAPMPEPGPGRLLVRVHAVGVNPPDWYAREGMPNVPDELKPPVVLPLIPGTDASGVVAAIGAGVEGFAVGDEVFGMLNFPISLQGNAYAEYVAASAADFAHKPAGVGHERAAAVAMSGLTAWAVPDRARPRLPVTVPGSAAPPDGARRREHGPGQRRCRRRRAPRAPARQVEGRTGDRRRLRRPRGVPA